MHISVAVEGIIDEAVARRLCSLTGHDVQTVYITRGKAQLDLRLAGFNSAARHNWWLVIRDLDKDEICASALIGSLLPRVSEFMCFRIAVRAAESWLLADRQSLSAFLGVNAAVLPRNPELLLDPKAAIVSASRRSRMRWVRDEMSPVPGSRNSVGPGYSGNLIEFIVRSWEPREAALHSQSLAKCIQRLEAIEQIS